jgi:hypothetical protein
MLSLSNQSRVILLWFVVGTNLFGLSASTAKVAVKKPVHAGSIQMPAGVYSLVWPNDKHDIHLLISVNGRHWAVPAVVEPDPKPGKERALTRRHKDGVALFGFKVNGLLILIH